MTVLQFERVSKCYRISQQDDSAPMDWRSRLKARMGGNHKLFWALRDVSFEVPSGQALGIIGHNGAGKSTLLKLLAGITSPTEGQIDIHGRIAGLLEVGSGFHPELTGRENVFLSGSVLGMKRRDIHKHLDSIVEFSELRPFIDVPVKRYSSGMYVRLGFAIAAHLNPDILLLDEILAVGDVGFQAKCFERIQYLHAERGITIVFVSHDLQAVSKLCGRVLVLQHGQTIFDGPPGEAMEAYHRSGQSFQQQRRMGGETAQITGVHLLDTNGQPVHHYRTGDPILIRVEYQLREAVPEADIDVFINTAAGDLSCQLSTRFSGPRLDLPAGAGCIEFTAPELALQSGLFRIDVTLERKGAPDPLDWLTGCSSLQVSGGRLRGMFYHPHSWRQGHGPTEV